MSLKINSSVPTDSEDILGILNNSPDTLKRIYKVHFPMILQMVLNNNGNEEDAKDIYQESIIILYNKVKAGDFELTSKLKTYIYSVCRRIWLKKLNQRSKKDVELKEIHDYLPVENDLEMHEMRDLQFSKMEESMLMLGEPCRTIIQDFYMQNKSMQEICDKFGYTNPENAKTQKYKCLQRLKKLFFQL
ncbi:RNA polymerase sigma factor [Mucilaginibacter arboris]|uniref:Sigma-70 family RNA polymerase sigma factor n=1 Tax=Mucilaginibacter arboris TaxID=2682090 RepID=A0A7K1SWY0_9SPHI|nr:sigma-70 family RNA polymerase sigma factor [Mucilaginibacter arboris]MVN21845.1 sigma-70 family RNA polymerase sigma factor [Mucilaginibacter arboris]